MAIKITRKLVTKSLYFTLLTFLMPYLNSSWNFLSENVYFWYGRAKISQVKLSWSSRGAIIFRIGWRNASWWRVQNTWPYINFIDYLIMIATAQNAYMYMYIHTGMRQRKIKKRGKLLIMWGSAATEPPGGGFGRGVPPPAENFAILGYLKIMFYMQRKIKKTRKIATCEGAQRPNLLGVGSGGGFPLPQKILQF